MATQFNTTRDYSPHQPSGEQLLPMESHPEMPGEEKKSVTLLVRHLPEAIPHDMLSKLFSYYGASSFRPCSGGSLRNCAFVDFKDETLASHAQAQLNRLKFHKKILSVEKASKTSANSTSQQGERHASSDLPSLPQPQLKDSLGKLQESTTSSASSSEPIASRLGLDYPFPPNLEYLYPPPDGNILTNIVNALIAVPRLYTQVLHLMNKMNIPAPFRMALPTPPLPPSVPFAPPPPPPPIPEELPPNSPSSEESELESSDEDMPSGVQNSRKRAKREAIVGPATDKGVAHEDVGLKPTTLVPKELPVIKKKNRVLQIKIAPKMTKKDEETSVVETMDESMEATESKPFLTPEELESGKLKLEEILSLPNFKRYAAGNPASVLYIKNLAKDVVVDDFYYIFGSLFGNVEASRTGLVIKLMKEGRMRDQAFITFPSVDLAQRALNLVNGYVFKGKPMIIQFSRNPDTKGN